MRILLVSHVSELYGAGRSLLALASGLRQRAREVYVVVPGPGSLTETLRQTGISVIEYESPWWAVTTSTSLKARQWYLRRTWAAADNLEHFIRVLRPDLVHTNSSVIAYGAIAAKRVGIPHIWHVREYGVEDFDLRFILGRTVSLQLMGLLSGGLIAISHSVAAAYTTPATLHKLHVVYNGVDLPPDLHDDLVLLPTQSEPILALTGILHRAKGQDEAIRALALLHQRGLSCRLILIGGDPIGYESTLRALVDELCVAPYVTFTGHLPDPLSQMAQADVVLMCSRSEGFGRVTVEAMLLGKPVVGANTGGTPEIIEDGRTGLLYQQGDPAHLAERIAELVSDPAKAARLGAAARQSAQSRFSVAQYVNGIEAIYRSVLANKAVPPT